jgi:hypothetical protein
MVRTQIQITQEQADVLKRIASREGISVAEVIRRALNSVVRTEILPPHREEIKRRAFAAAGCFHSGVRDLATRHDDYWAEDIENDLRR